MWQCFPREVWEIICDGLYEARDLTRLKLTCKAICMNTPSWQWILERRMQKYVLPITLSLRRLISCKPAEQAIMHATARELTAMRADFFANMEPIMAIFMRALCEYSANIANAQLAIRIVKKIVGCDRATAETDEDKAQHLREYQIYVLTYLHSTALERKQCAQTYSDAKKIVPRATADEYEKYRSKMPNGYMVQMLYFACGGPFN